MRRMPESPSTQQSRRKRRQLPMPGVAVSRSAATIVAIATAASVLYDLAAASPLSRNAAQMLAASLANSSSSTGTDHCAAFVQQNIVNNQFVIGKASSIIACYNSFTISAEQKKSQIDALSGYYNIYPFLDIANGTYAPFFESHVDILSSLGKLANDTSLTSEYEFQSAVAKAVWTLNDGHASYTPKCFVNVPIFLPFVFSALYEKPGATKPEIVVRDALTKGSGFFLNGNATETALADALDSWWGTNGLNGEKPSKYKGYTVVSIDGVKALQFVQDYADVYTAISRSPESRFNAVLASYAFKNSPSPVTELVDGAFYARKFFPPTLPDYHTLVLLGPTGDKVTVKAYWAALPIRKNVSNALTSASGYYKSYCSSSKVASSKTGSERDEDDSSLSNSGIVRLQDDLLRPLAFVPKASGAGAFHQLFHGLSKRPSHVDLVALAPTPPSRKDILDMVMPHMNRMIDSIKAKDSARNAFSLSSPVKADENGAFYQLTADTGVWVLATFMPKDDTDAGIVNWLSNVTTGLVALEQLGVTRLLIDVSNNGGGIVCAGQALMEFLFPDQQLIHFSYDIRASSIMVNLFEDTVNGPNAAAAKSAYKDSVIFTTEYMNSPAYATPLKSLQDLFEPGKTVVRGGKSGQYSNRFIEASCSDFKKAIKDSSAFPQLKSGWGPQNIALLSNGLCGSTCAAVTRTLREQFNNKIRTYTYGGASATPFQPTSFAGGCVAHFSTLLAGAQRAYMANNNTAVPGGPLPFTLPVDGSIPFWESYSILSNTDVPVEFVKQPSEEWLEKVVDPTDAVSVWQAAAERLALTAAKGNGKS
ncbi:hypothetical protein DFJ73DRAFT_463258 [Zopfochytrium polystomum]|nr:hypothetical protein DFJ73DRAFT_463258 [Zopfochytrium polystomum]